MMPLEELWLRWQDGSITEPELIRLNQLLADPAARARLAREMIFDADLRESFRAQASVARAQSSKEAFVAGELRSAAVTADRSIQLRWLGWVRRVFAHPAARPASLGMAALVLLALAAARLVLPFLAPSQIARLESNAAAVTVLRQDRELAPAPSLALIPGDQVRTAPQAGARILYPDKISRIELEPGTRLTVEGNRDGQRLELVRGTLAVKIGPQPRGRPFRIQTPQAEATVLGTEFVITAREDFTRLEVTEGSVRFAHREDGRAINVAPGACAIAKPGADLALRPLLPPPWQSQDIGAVALPGSARFEGPRCSAKGSGRAESSGRDRFHFVYQPLEGDGEIQVRVLEVEPTQGLAKAGVVIRENLRADSPQAFLFSRGRGGVFFDRRGNGAVRSSLLTNSTSPCWLRLVRRADAITAYVSPDGAAWQQAATDIVPLPFRVYIGLGVSSFKNDVLAASVFDHVEVAAAAAIKPQPSLPQEP